MNSCRPLAMAVLLGLILAAVPVRAQQVTTSTVEGITNFKRLETTVACAGETKPTAVAALKKMGYASIINLRLPNEQGADLEGEAAAAKRVGIPYYWIPFDGAMPDPSVVDKFLDTITAKGIEPAFIHCHSGNRAAALWMIKRMVVDHWNAERAGQEATALGLTSGALKQFAIDYAQTHKR
jgi:protein tyrosine phosphatase (PTP) superfamily phosphohydrolase (DUF442 family)